MVDGTPILDIKPYVPHYDRIENSLYPSWIDDSPVKPFEKVVWEPEILKNFETQFLLEQESQPTTLQRSYYSSFTKLKDSIEQILSFDIRSRNQRSIGMKSDSVAQPFSLRFDQVRVHVIIDDKNRTVSVIQVDWVSRDDVKEENFNKKEEENEVENFST